VFLLLSVQDLYQPGHMTSSLVCISLDLLYCHYMCVLSEDDRVSSDVFDAAGMCWSTICPCNCRINGGVVGGGVMLSVC